MNIKKERFPIKKVTYLNEEISINETENSLASPFDTCIILALSKLVGEHEGINTYNLDQIDLSNGWNGAPIAVASQDDRVFDQLGPGIHIVENMDYGDLGVLDGHHRLTKSREEGYIYVVTQLFPLIHPNIVIDTWLENYQPLTADQVRKYLRTPRSIVPPKATKFQIIDNNGEKRRIMEMQPIVRVGSKTLKGNNDQNKTRL